MGRKSNKKRLHGENSRESWSRENQTSREFKYHPGTVKPRAHTEYQYGDFPAKRGEFQYPTGR